jgi:hypothetical protein
VLYAAPATTLCSGDDVVHTGTGAAATGIVNVRSVVKDVGPVARIVTDAFPDEGGVPDTVPLVKTDIQESPPTLEYEDVAEADTDVEYATVAVAEGRVVPVIQTGAD